ncbi:MAG: PilW family protein [Gammaproteobacteria bacterium]|jgi:type IV pilus assembly protein PilW
MRQHGFTLVEMMIAVVIGLLLIAGTLSVYLGSKQGYRLASGLTLMQATGRATLDLLTRDIMLAGFPQAAGIEAVVPGTGFTEDGGGSNSDRITVHYQSSVDCLNSAGGTPVYADGMQYAKNRYFVQNGNLMCEALAEDNTVVQAGVMVEGIENLQILYGEDHDATDGVTNATRYITAGNVTDWDNVVSVRIGIIVASRDNIATTDDTSTFSLIGQAPAAAAGDHRRRRAYSTTAVIRNRMQES